MVSPADFDTDTLGKPLTATAGRDAAKAHVEEQSGPAAMCTGRKDGCWAIAGLWLGTEGCMLSPTV